MTAAVLLLPSFVAIAVLAALWAAGAWEWASFAELRSAARIAFVVSLVILMAATLAAFGPGLADALLVVAMLWWLLAFLAVLSYPRAFSRPAVAVAGALVLVPSWALLAGLHQVGGLGHALTMTVLVIVWAADVGAYAAGRLFGRVKLAPKVSPGKTWEGVGGGLVLAALAAWAVGPSTRLAGARARLSRHRHGPRIGAGRSDREHVQTQRGPQGQRAAAARSRRCARSDRQFDRRRAGVRARVTIRRSRRLKGTECRAEGLFSGGAERMARPRSRAGKSGVGPQGTRGPARMNGNTHPRGLGGRQREDGSVHDRPGL